MSDAERLLAIYRSRGVVSTDIRDACHEAHHAIVCGLRKSWTRDNVHRAILRVYGARNHYALVHAEIVARAVEAIVCQRLGVAYDVKEWALVMWMETFKNMRVRLPSVEWVVEAVNKRIGSTSIERHADDVMAVKSKANRPRAEVRQ